MIPSVDPTTGVLPIGIYTASLAEVHETFVNAAPFPERRELIFKALSVYIEIVRDTYPQGRFLLNGGFVTHKTWAAPKDVDLAIGLGAKEFKSTFAEEHIGAWTLDGVLYMQPQPPSGNGPGSVLRLQPVLGLVDSHFFPSGLPNVVHYWEDLWSRVKDENGNEISGLRKGYIEVEP